MSCTLSSIRVLILFFFKGVFIPLSLLLNQDHFARDVFFSTTKYLCFYFTFLYLSFTDYLIISPEFVLNSFDGVDLLCKHSSNLKILLSFLFFKYVFVYSLIIFVVLGIMDSGKIK